MFATDAFVTRVTTRHHISIGENGAVDLAFGKSLAQFLNVEGFNCNVSQLAEILPCFYPVEHFEDQNPKQHIFRAVAIQVFIDDIPYQVLADTVTGAIHIGELILLEDGVVRQKTVVLTPPPEDVHPLLDKVEIIFQCSIVGDNAAILFRPHKYPAWAG